MFGLLTFWRNHVIILKSNFNASAADNFWKHCGKSVLLKICCALEWVYSNLALHSILSICRTHFDKLMIEDLSKLSETLFLIQRFIFETIKNIILLVISSLFLFFNLSYIIHTCIWSANILRMSGPKHWKSLWIPFPTYNKSAADKVENI